MESKYICEVMQKGLCLGCVGIAEKDWVGKYQCEFYKKNKTRAKLYSFTKL